MKHYDREKKKWISEEEFEKKNKLKRRQLCRGGQPHDFVLVIPSYYRVKTSYTAKEVAAFYSLMTEYYETMKRFRQKALELNLVRVFHSWDTEQYRHYSCSVCGKQKIDHENR